MPEGPCVSGDQGGVAEDAAELGNGMLMVVEMTKMAMTE